MIVSINDQGRIEMRIYLITNNHFLPPFTNLQIVPQIFPSDQAVKDLSEGSKKQLKDN